MRHSGHAGGALAALLLAAAPAFGQGASVYLHSACMLARAAAGVADPCADGSAVFYNPAALALQRGALAAGILAVHLAGEFTFDTTGATFRSRQGTLPVPHLWATHRATPRLGVGVGAWAPYGLQTQWPLAFEGRYVGYDNELRTLYLQPTVAWQVVPDRLAVGGGVAIVFGAVDLKQRIDLAATSLPGTGLTFAAIGVPRGTDFADLRLEADAWTAAFHVGVLVRPLERLAVGARYLNRARLESDDGTATFRQVPTGIRLPPGNPFGVPAGTPLDAVLAPRFAPGAPLGDQGLATELTLPNQFVVGVRYRVASDALVVADFQWTGWSTFDEVPLVFSRAPADTLLLDFVNTRTLRLGADWLVTESLALRGGVFYNDAATPAVTVTPLLPEGRRLTVATGLGYRLTDRLVADAGFEYVFQERRRGRVRPRTSRAQTAGELAAGAYEGRGRVVGLTLSYRLGPSVPPGW